MKRCIGCGDLKEPGEFYAHPAMADGHLNKCKLCCRKDANLRREKKLLDPEWVRKERARCREKQVRYRLSGRARSSPEARRRWGRRNREKIRAQQRAHRAYRKGLLAKPKVCQACGKPTEDLEKHHSDYSKPLLVVWLCTKCHGETRRKP